MNDIKVSIVGASGYTGGELIRLLVNHPKVKINQVTSERLAGKSVTRSHPNLRKGCDLKFCSLSDIAPADLIFLCLPHGKSMNEIEKFKALAPKLIDLSGDFRLKDPTDYDKWYGHPHTNPQYLSEFIYGIPELHREAMKKASYISSAGCNATTTILGVYPLFKMGLVDTMRTVVEVKVGSSEGGNAVNEGSHHPERSGCVRSFMPTGHRHTAEIHQELGFGKPIQVHFSATSIDMIRGVLATSHLFLKENIEEKEIWKVYREVYGKEPFIRIVKDSHGNYRYPEPKLLSGTNFCDVGFEKDPHSNRVVVISAIDNLMKGAAGQALQAMNLMMGLDETLGLEFQGLHPI